MEFSDAIITGGAGLAGAGGGCSIGWYMIRRLLDEVATLKRELQRLRDEEVKELKTQLVSLQGKCNAETIAADQKNLLGWLKKIDAGMELVKDRTSKMQGTIEGQAKWLENINIDLQAHEKNYDIHKFK